MTVFDELEQLATATSPKPWRQDRVREAHCVAGHEYTPENTRWRRQNGKPYRVCRACSRLHAGFKGAYKPRKTKGARDV